MESGSSNHVNELAIETLWVVRCLDKDDDSETIYSLHKTKEGAIKKAEAYNKGFTGTGLHFYHCAEILEE